MPQASFCSSCGRPLTPGMATGQCVRCLLKRGMEAPTAGFEATDGAAARQWEPPTPGDLAGQFAGMEVTELLGRGGMGAVYKALQTQLDRVVALKVLPPDIAADPGFADRFAREAKALARLNHPNVVTLYEFGRTSTGLYYFLMEYVDGVNLRQLMNGGRVAPREALAIVPQVCDALQYAHDKGIVHRDIKPENILLDRRGNVKVADFGLAKITGHEEPAGAQASATVGLALTEAGKIVGTPQYMAPEQEASFGNVDHRADIYALGVVFYQMLTGELPARPAQPPSRKLVLDVRLDEVVLRALEREPGLRYTAASMMKTAVETIASRPPVMGSVGVDYASPGVGRARFSRTAIVGAALLLLFIAIGVLGPAITGPVRNDDRRGMAMVEAAQVFAFGLLFAATILGWIALSQIRRSAGAIRGRALAMFDGLIFPLLAMNGLIVALISKLATIVADFYANTSNADNPQVHPPLMTEFANFIADHRRVPILFAVALVIVVDVLIVRWVWRAAAPQVKIGDSQAVEVPKFRAHHTNTTLASVALFCAIMSGVIPTIFYWMAPWFLPWLTPRGQQFAIWMTLITALLAIGLGFTSYRSGKGRTAIFMGAVSLGIWMMFFVVGQLVEPVANAGNARGRYPLLYLRFNRSAANIPKRPPSRTTTIPR